MFAAKKEAKKAIRITRDAAAYVKADVIKAKTEVRKILELAVTFAQENEDNTIFKAAAKVEAARSVEENIEILADEVAEEITKIEAAAEAAEAATTGSTAKVAAGVATIGAEATRNAARKSAAAVRKLEEGWDMRIYDDYYYSFDNCYGFEDALDDNDYYYDDDDYYYFDDDDDDDNMMMMMMRWRR